MIRRLECVLLKWREEKWAEIREKQLKRSDQEIDALVKDTPYYSWTRIPASAYPASSEGVGTFGVTATVMSTSDVDAELVYGLVKAVFEGLEQFKAYHPAFADLKPERMVKDGLTAPLHEGALRYYRETGLIND